MGPSWILTLSGTSAKDLPDYPCKTWWNLVPGGGRTSTVDIVVAPQTQKKVIFALFQLLDLPHVFITVLHQVSIRVR